MAGPFLRVFRVNWERSWREHAKFFKSVSLTMGNEEFGGMEAMVQGILYRAAGPINSSTAGAILIGPTLNVSTLIATGAGLRIRIKGVTAANGNTKTIVFKFGTASITLYSGAGSGIDFYYDITIVRTSLNNQQITVAGYAGSTLVSGLDTAATQTETNALVCEVSLSTATGNADVVVNDFLVEGESG